MHEKYLALARDAASNGDRVLTESYFQHAEHYFRILNAFNDDGGPDPQRSRDHRPIHDHIENGEAPVYAGGPQPDIAPLSSSDAQPASPGPVDIAATPQPEMAVDLLTPAPGGDAPQEPEPSADSAAGQTPASPPPSPRPDSNGISRAAPPRANGDAGEATSGVTVTVVSPANGESAPEPATPTRRRAGSTTLTLNKTRTKSDD